MRARLWALYLFVFLVGGVILLFQGWRTFRANERVRQYILSEIRPILGEECDIDYVHISYGTIHVGGVRLPLNGGAYELEIEVLRIGYNFFRLLARGFDPQAVSQNILFSNPRLTIRLDNGGAAVPGPAAPPGEGLAVAEDAGSTAGSGAPAQGVAGTENGPERDRGGVLRELNFLSRVLVQDGELALSRGDTAEIRLAHSIDGWLMTDHADSVFIRLDGHLFDSEQQNLAITGAADRRQEAQYRIRGALLDYSLTERLPLLLPGSLSFSGGVINGEFLLSGSGRDAALSGELRVSGGQAATADSLLILNDLELLAELRDRDLLIRRASQRLNGVPVSFGGAVTNLLDPELGLRVRSDSLELGRFARLFGEDMAGRLSGVTVLRASVTGPGKSPRLDARLSSDSVRVSGSLLSGILVRAGVAGGRVRIDTCRAGWDSQQIDLSGTVDLNEPDRPVRAVAVISGDVSGLLQPVATDSLLACPTFLSAQISGPLALPEVLGDCGLSFWTATGDSLAAQADFSVREGRFTLNSRELGSGHQHRISASVDLTASPPEFELDLDHIEEVIYAMVKMPVERYAGEALHLDVDLQGTTKEYRVNADLSRTREDYSLLELLHVEADLRQLETELRGIGRLWLHPDTPFESRGKFLLKKDATTLSVQEFVLGDEISAVFGAKTGPSGLTALFGELDLVDMPVSRLLGTIDSTLTGSLTMEMSLGGTNLNPLLTLNGRLDDALVLRAGPYDSDFSLRYNDSVLELRPLRLMANGSELLRLEGRYAVRRDELDLRATGEDFDAALLAAILQGGRPSFSGRTALDLEVTGSTSVPHLSGNFEVTGGRFGRLKFDRLAVGLGFLQNPEVERRLMVPQLLFNSIELVRDGRFEVTGRGALPFHRDDSLYFEFDGRGDFLVLLNDLEDYFGETYSEGRLSARILGTPANPLLDNASLRFENGRMVFGSVVPEVTGLRGDIVFDPENLFVNIGTLEGLMGGRPFRIHNERAAPELSVRDLEDLELGSPGINFGVLVLETPERGVPLNISGLMEPGVFGRLDLGGRGPGEKFYLAGPPDRPLLRGTINLYDVELMYPFSEGAGEPSETVREFLENLEWDIYVVPFQDTKFVRTFPGAIDEVYVNLTVDERYGGLEFTGQVMDESFRINGEVRSTSGFIEYLNLTFRLERAGVDFDRSSLIPVAYGQARTTIADSTGIPSQVILTLQTIDWTIDENTADGIVRQEEIRGRWEELRFKITTDNPSIGTSEAQILSALGYTPDNIQGTAVDAIGFSTENILFRPLFRPMERKLEQLFGFDYVRFSSRFAKNFIDFNLNNNLELNTRLALLRSTKVILGKYIANSFFLQYTGQVEAGIDYRYQERGMGLHHTLGLEYRISPQLLLELEYDYESLMYKNKDDKRILLRHWFPF